MPPFLIKSHNRLLMSMKLPMLKQQNKLASFILAHPLATRKVTIAGAIAQTTRPTLALSNSFCGSYCTFFASHLLGKPV